MLFRCKKTATAEVTSIDRLAQERTLRSPALPLVANGAVPAVTAGTAATAGRAAPAVATVRLRTVAAAARKVAARRSMRTAVAARALWRV